MLQPWVVHMGGANIGVTLIYLPLTYGWENSLKRGTHKNCTVAQWR